MRNLILRVLDRNAVHRGQSLWLVVVFTFAPGIALAQSPRAATYITDEEIIIPAGVPHGWTDIADHVDYLSVRPDPDRLLPKDYVNPAIRK